MQVKTILNRVQKFKSFVDSAVRWVEAPGGEPAIEAELRPRTGSRGHCSGCGRGSVHQQRTGADQRDPGGQRHR